MSINDDRTRKANQTQRQKLLQQVVLAHLCDYVLLPAGQAPIEKSAIGERARTLAVAVENPGWAEIKEACLDLARRHLIEWSPEPYANRKDRVGRGVLTPAGQKVADAWFRSRPRPGGP